MSERNPIIEMWAKADGVSYADTERALWELADMKPHDASLCPVCFDQDSTGCFACNGTGKRVCACGERCWKVGGEVACGSVTA